MILRLPDYGDEKYGSTEINFGRSTNERGWFVAEQFVDNNLEYVRSLLPINATFSVEFWVGLSSALELFKPRTRRTLFKH